MLGRASLVTCNLRLEVLLFIFIRPEQICLWASRQLMSGHNGHGAPFTYLMLRTYGLPRPQERQVYVFEKVYLLMHRALCLC